MTQEVLQTMASNELRGLLYTAFPTMSACAEALNTNLNTLGRYIRGERVMPLGMAVKLAARCDLTMDAFVERVYPKMVAEAHNDAR